MKEMEIFWSDLTPEAQKRALEAAGISDPKEANWDMDILPVAIAAFGEGE